MKLRFLLPVFCLALWFTGVSQPGWTLALQPTGAMPEGVRWKSRFETAEGLRAYVQSIPGMLLGMGYLAASVDSLYLDSPRAVARIYAGEKYTWATLQTTEEYAAIARELGFPVAGQRPQKNTAGGKDYRELMLDYLANHGYPFAVVQYDSVTLKGNRIYARLQVARGSLYRIDSIAQTGPLRMKPSFLYRYLGLQPGMPYQAARLTRIGQRLNELPFALQARPWQLQMLGTGAVVNTHLEARRSNVLNVLAGVMPASAQTPGNKLLVTGEANILLRNSFRSGETISLNWQQIQYRSPRLNLGYQQSYLFGSRAGADFFFEIFKKDTQFVNLQVRIGMPWEFSLTAQGKVLFLHQQTNVTGPDTAFVLANRRLPDLGASSLTSLGLDYTFNTTDYRLNPRRGTEAQLFIAGGTKKINPLAAVQNLKDPVNPGQTFARLYDSLAADTWQMRIRLHLARYVPLGAQSVLRLGFSAATYESGNYFRNELFQIGGFRTLRGFDEESIFARRFAVFSAEYRLLTGTNSYFYGFTDMGYAQYRDQLQQFANGYYGAGLGLVLQTKNSLVNLAWAAGKRSGLPFELRQSKIHLGLINFF